MDPNAALRELRDITALIKQHRRMTQDQLDHMSELFEGLDNWITQGGFLPKVWNPAPVPVSALGEIRDLLNEQLPPHWDLDTTEIAQDIIERLYS